MSAHAGTRTRNGAHALSEMWENSQTGQAPRGMFGWEDRSSASFHQAAQGKRFVGLWGDLNDGEVGARCTRFPALLATVQPWGPLSVRYHVAAWPVHAHFRAHFRGTALCAHARKRRVPGERARANPCGRSMSAPIQAALKRGTYRLLACAGERGTGRGRRRRATQQNAPRERLGSETVPAAPQLASRTARSAGWQLRAPSTARIAGPVGPSAAAAGNRQGWTAGAAAGSAAAAAGRAVRAPAHATVSLPRGADHPTAVGCAVGPALAPGRLTR